MDTKLKVIGFAGDEVDIAGPDAGRQGIWLETDVEGFVDPEISTITKTFANRPGQKFISHRVIERTIIFKVLIENGSGDGNTWLERDARWRRLWSFGEYTTIRCTSGYGVPPRDLKVRLEKIEVDTRYDPKVNSATSVVMTVVADDPFWYAPDVVREFVVSPTAPVSITVQNPNPTENPVFPVWVLAAPGRWTITDYDEVTKTTRQVELPYLDVGQDAVVNQDPAARQIQVADESLVWGKMNGVRFRGAIPPRSGPITFTATIDSAEATRGQLRLPRPYSRPWGEV